MFIYFRGWHAIRIPKSLFLFSRSQRSSSVAFFTSHAVVAVHWHPSGSKFASCDKNKNCILWTDLWSKRKAIRGCQSEATDLFDGAMSASPRPSFPSPLTHCSLSSRPLETFPIWYKWTSQQYCVTFREQKSANKKTNPSRLWLVFSFYRPSIVQLWQPKLWCFFSRSVALLDSRFICVSSHSLFYRVASLQDNIIELVLFLAIS